MLFRSVIYTFCGKTVDVYGGLKQNLTNVWQYNYNGTDSQKWNVLVNSPGSFTFISLCNNLALDIYGGKIASSTNVDTYASNGTAAQKWDLIPVT